MIYKFLKTVICAVFLLTGIAVHADDDPGMGMEDEYGNVNDYDLEAPISSKLAYLAMAGVFIAFVYAIKLKSISAEK